MWNKIQKNLSLLYSKEEVNSTVSELKKLVRTPKTKRSYKTSSKDITLITYADSISSKNKKSLKNLNAFIREFELNKVINSTHILPFYPWDTDKGFSVIDYQKVDQRYGGWNDINNLSKSTRLMFDFVANHASIMNHLVQNSLIEKHLPKNDSRYSKFREYKDFVIAFDNNKRPSDDDLKMLARPRPTPVLSPYFVSESGKELVAILGTPSTYPNLKGKVIGKGLVWTTFSRNKNASGIEETKQVDLNFKNPKVLIETIKILLFYIKNGASLIRLDAIGYIWKKFGSSSLHEKEAHLILEIIHSLMNHVAPQVITISEVNEQQDKFFEYLGSKNHEESDMVYQFSPFPLAVYAILTGNATAYKKWLPTTSKFKGRQFITVLGSHDGLGLKPVRNILPLEELNEFSNTLVNKYNGLPNFAILPGGEKIIYEICSTPWNLINLKDSTESLNTQIYRYLAVLAMGLIVKGIPGIYFNGLVGAENYNPKNGLDENRTVNRESFDYSLLKKELLNKNSRMFQVFNSVVKILAARSANIEFSPNAQDPVMIETDNQSIVGVKLISEDKKNTLFSFINVSNKSQIAKMPKHLNLLNKNKVIFNSHNSIPNKENPYLLPYQVLWVKK